MSATEEEEARAEAWLRARRYRPFRPTKLALDHPARLAAERGNPDYWAESQTLNPPHLWIEVKSIDPDNFEKAMRRLSDPIRAADIPPGLHGRAMMELDTEASEHSVRMVLKGFKKQSIKFVGQKVSLIFLQQTPSCHSEYQVEIDAEAPIVVWARASGLPLSSGLWFGNDISYANARVRTPDGRELIGPAHHFFRRTVRMECVLAVRLDPKDRLLDGIGYHCGGIGQGRERTVAALEKANRQIKEACATREAPGLVMLIPRGKFAVDDDAMQAAMYGQFTVSFPLGGDDGEDTGIYHGLDGVFRPTKNTHISAAVHVRPQGPATFFPNPYALHPISENASLFAGLVRTDVKFVPA
jgi:hypothetical protein